MSAAEKPVELNTAPGCPHSADAREDLEWRGIPFVEYDVERDPEAQEFRTERFPVGPARRPLPGQPGQSDRREPDGEGGPIPGRGAGSRSPA